MNIVHHFLIFILYADYAEQSVNSCIGSVVQHHMFGQKIFTQLQYGAIFVFLLPFGWGYLGPVLGH